MVQQNIDKIISNYLTKNILFTEENLLATKLSLLDTLGCIYNASTYEDPMRFATRGKFGSNTNPFLVINGMQSSKEITRYLSILTRWFDYNDTFLAKEWAHPSDNIGTAFGYFFNHIDKNLSQFFQSIIQMYEIQGCLALGTSLNEKGYDHVFYVKLASGVVFSSLLSDQNKDSISRTVNNILQDGVNLRSYRQAPNVGKRKSWAAGDAASRGIEIAEISEFPDNIYKNIQDDQIWGFNKVFLDDDILSFGKELDDWVIQNILFKVLYPAEFHGQSAVEASFQLSDLFHEKEKDIKEIIIETHEPALRIISNKKELNNSSDRDHSLEYMVSAALIFSDYMRPSIRLASLMKVNSLFIFTHDSIYLGEDGPTHQPVEHLMSMRLIPNLDVIRPANSKELIHSYRYALEKRDNPKAIILSRQNIKFFDHDVKYKDFQTGAYEFMKGTDITLIATGSELELAVEISKKLSDFSVQIISAPILNRLSEERIESVIC